MRQLTCQDAAKEEGNEKCDKEVISEVAGESCCMQSCLVTVQERRRGEARRIEWKSRHALRCSGVETRSVNHEGHWRVAVDPLAQALAADVPDDRRHAQTSRHLCTECTAMSLAFQQDT